MKVMMTNRFEFMEPIFFKNRRNNEIEEEYVPSGKILSWFYNKPLGKVSLHLLMKRKLVSSLGGWYMNSRLSKGLISKFIERNKIDLSIYQIKDSSAYKNFNDFFYRKIEISKRPVGDAFVSPADGKILAFQSMRDVASFFIKGSQFTISSFLKNDQLAKRYADGAMMIVRLAPADYHRFHFPADGVISASKLIKGKYFSVSPLALRKSLQIFCQNTRVYSTLQTEDYGDVIISEVGASMVGSIFQTYQPNTNIKKGSEKGYFAFGGSTIVLFFEKDKIKIDQDLLDNTRSGLETTVHMGENIAG